MTYILRLKGFVYIVINGFHCIFLSEVYEKRKEVYLARPALSLYYDKCNSKNYFPLFSGYLPLQTRFQTYYVQLP